MGAVLQVTEYNTQKSSEIKSRFNSDLQDIENEIITEFEYENPGEEVDGECFMYTGSFLELGSIGKIYPKIAKTYEEAEQIIGENHSKWTSAMVVHLENGNSLVGGWCSCWHQTTI